MSITRASRALLLPCLVLAGCALSDQKPGGYESVAPQIASYYRDRAMEANATCPNPEITAITATRVVSETPQRVTMDVRYRWVDESRATDLGNGGSMNTCTDWGERTFTFARNDGALTVTDMSGPQKQL